MYPASIANFCSSSSYPRKGSKKGNPYQAGQRPSGQKRITTKKEAEKWVNRSIKMPESQVNILKHGVSLLRRWSVLGLGDHDRPEDLN
ncbi:hypothetical protein RCL_jg23148.t1 [Rhizophagus clarus]|nr:hypothetical protein RCL_jg23148.t1 [Rhizophagus clarus]